MKKAFIIETFNSTEQSESSYCHSDSSERAQEFIEAEGDFMTALMLDRILTVEQFTILSHFEALVGYDKLVSLARNSPNGKLSGVKMLQVLNGDDLEELELAAIWEDRNLMLQYNSILQLRIANASVYENEIQVKARNLIKKVPLEEFISYAQKEYNIYSLETGFYEYFSYAKANIKAWDEKCEPKVLATLMCFFQEIRNRIIYDVRFINADEEKKISPYSFIELYRMLFTEESYEGCFVKETDSFGEEYCEVEGFWFSPCTLDYNSRVIVTRGSSSNSYLND